ncbi:30S ribosomal protein 3-1 chloroplastic [Phtheirospermum japonicum]|uniref:30S ribosomal protein 3-1 chloroplastic n=1 Tax=Phtheirospermum japonicum TaxID=374723 RepID=A0A830CQI5_9LAMI|nr:30S ribosomal protein 3-1 chloroplastic [Phtheirospermum japonicum]
MLSMSVQPSINGTLPSPFSIASKKTFNSSVSVNPNALSLHSLSNPDLKTKPGIRKFQKLPAVAAATELAPSETTAEISDSEPQVLADVKIAVAKPRLVLKFIWMEKNIGLGLDQVIPGHGTVPLSPYFFWPRKDAWEELKTTLESKPWISQKKMIILLNQATDIINLWQQSGGNLS